MHEFRILGPLEVERDGVPVRVTAPKQRATLALLLLNANRVVSVDELADALYSGAPPVTAVTQVQRQISELRKTVGEGVAIETRAPGYVIRLGQDDLDLSRFERLSAEALRSREQRDWEAAAATLAEALPLWRGAPLADVGYEAFAQAAVGRLEELRLDALERRIEADLALGRHGALVGELETLVAEHSLREQFVAQLMLALYRSGRQADALAAYRKTRAALVGSLGIEPTASLRDLEQRILRQDPSLELSAEPPARTASAQLRTVLAVAFDERSLDSLVLLAEPLAQGADRELILTRLVANEREVAGAAEALNVRRASLDVRIRTAAFATDDPADDVVRLARSYDVDLVLIDEPPGLDGARVPAELASLFERSTADVAVARPGRSMEGQGVYVVFGGGRHEWAAAELGAWLAKTLGVRLTLVGTRADVARGRRDASRLLAHAALAVQQIARVDAAPLLAEPSAAGLLAAVADASIVVAGVSDQWRRHGIGDLRRALLVEARQPVLFVHKGLRPGGLAPRVDATRFTWSLERSAPYLQGVSSAPT